MSSESQGTVINHRGRRLSTDGATAPMNSSDNLKIGSSSTSTSTKLPVRSSPRPQPLASSKGLPQMSASPLTYDALYSPISPPSAGQPTGGFFAPSAPQKGTTKTPMFAVGVGGGPISGLGAIRPSMLPKRPLTVGAPSQPFSARGPSSSGGAGFLAPKRPLTQQLSRTETASTSARLPSSNELPPLTGTPSKKLVADSYHPRLSRADTASYLPAPTVDAAEGHPAEAMVAPIVGVVPGPTGADPTKPLTKGATKGAGAPPLAATQKLSPAAAAAAIIAFQDAHGGIAQQRRRSASREGQSISKATTAADEGSSSQQYAKSREAKIKLSAATIIKDLVASFDKDYYSARVSAAITIQCAWRSAKARLECFGRRQVFLHYVHVSQRAAVTCLVSFFKGILLKRRRLHIKDRQAAKLAERIDTERRQRSAVLKIIGAIRRYMARKKETQRLMRLLRIKQEEKLSYCRAAAVIVQRWFRIVRVERAYWRRRHIELAEQEAKKAEARRVDTAATKIQKLFRGAEGRKFALDFKTKKERDRLLMLRRIRESIDVVRVFLKTFVLRKQREAATGERLVVSDDGATVSAIPIEMYDVQRKLLTSTTEAEGKSSRNPAGPDDDNKQARPTESEVATAAMRQLEQREAQRKLDNELTQRMVREAQRIVYHRAMEAARSCLKIQCCWRSSRARRELRVLRRIATTHDQMRIEREFKLFKAVCLVQRCANAASSQILCDRVRQYQNESYWRSLSLVQSVGKGLTARRQLRQHQLVAEEMSLAVVRASAETFERNTQIIQGFALAKQSVSVTAALLDTKAERDAELMVEVREAVLRDQSAEKIQKLARSKAARHATRLKVSELNAAKGRILTAVLAIQGFARLVSAKKRVTALRREADHKKRLRALEVGMAEATLLGFLAAAEGLEDDGRREIIRLGCNAWALMLAGPSDWAICQPVDKEVAQQGVLLDAEEVDDSDLYDM